MHGRPGRACTCGVVDFLGFEFEDDGDSSCGQDGGQRKPPQLFIWGRGTRRTRLSVSIWCDVRLPHLRLTKGQSSDVAAAEPRSLHFRPLTALLPAREHGVCIAVQSFIPQIIRKLKKKCFKVCQHNMWPFLKQDFIGLGYFKGFGAPQWNDSALWGGRVSGLGKWESQ